MFPEKSRSNKNEPTRISVPVSVSLYIPLQEYHMKTKLFQECSIVRLDLLKKIENKKTSIEAVLIFFQGFHALIVKIEKKYIVTIISVFLVFQFFSDLPSLWGLLDDE